MEAEGGTPMERRKRRKEGEGRGEVATLDGSFVNP